MIRKLKMNNKNKKIILEMEKLDFLTTVSDQSYNTTMSLTLVLGTVAILIALAPLLSSLLKINQNYILFGAVIILLIQMVEIVLEHRSYRKEIQKRYDRIKSLFLSQISN